MVWNSRLKQPSFPTNGSVTFRGLSLDAKSLNRGIRRRNSSKQSFMTISSSCHSFESKLKIFREIYDKHSNMCNENGRERSGEKIFVRRT